MALSPILLALVLIAPFALVLLSSDRSRKRLPLPPGPPGLPIIGNLLDIPRSREWLKYAEWSRQYGKLAINSLLVETVFCLIVDLL
jgi:hypothetical protein